LNSVVLLSAGLDSTVNLYAAKKSGKVFLALTFNYGQRAAKKEIQSAKKICKELSVPLKVIDLNFFSDLGGSSLIDHSKKIPTGSNIKMGNLKASKKSAKSVWVPNRNGIFLNIGAGFAESLGAKFLIPGFNAEEAQTFPDNSNAFLKSLSKAFLYSTSNKVKTHCFTTHLQKAEIVKLGLKLNVNWRLIWPCYFSGKKWCGQCESCQRSLRAFKTAGVNLE
jgi:7-cyano-7-deazaguanine synthase